MLKLWGYIILFLSYNYIKMLISGTNTHIMQQIFPPYFNFEFEVANITKLLHNVPIILCF